MAKCITWIERHVKIAIWIYRGCLALLFVVAALGYGGPEATKMGWLGGFEGWLTSHTRDPIAVAFLAGLILWTWFIPSALAFWKKHRNTGHAELSVSDPQHIASAHANAGGKYRVSVHNSGPATASNVQMKLRGISPGPRTPSWPADYPYSVMQPGCTLDSNDCRINANDDAFFEVCFVHSDGNSGRFAVGGLDTRNAGTGLPTIGVNERWELKYEVTAENAELLKFALEIFLEDGCLFVKKKG